jgi:hypothetical protein
MSIFTETNRRDDLFIGVTAASIADALLKLGSVNSDSDSSSNSSSSSSGRKKRNSPSALSSSSSSPATTSHDDDKSMPTIDTIIPTNNKRSRSNYSNNTYHQTTAISTSTLFRSIPRPSLGYYSLGGGGSPPHSSSSHHNPKKVVSDDEDEGRYFNNARTTTTTKFSTNKFPQINFNNKNKMIPGEIGPIHSSSQSSGFPKPLGAPLGAPPLLPMGIVVEKQKLCHPTPFSAPSSTLFSHQQRAPPATATPSMSSAVITQHNDCFIMHSYTILPRNNNNN